MKNKYEIRGDVTAIFINSRKYVRLEALISTSELDKVNEFPRTWFICNGRKNGSGYVGIHTPTIDGIRGTMLLHRLLTDAPEGMVVDHINHDTLDNTNKNLRVCTNKENLQNRKGASCSNVTSGIRGVSWDKKSNKWRAKVMIDYKFNYLGLYENIDDAERAVIDFRRVNMPFSKEESK